MADQWIGVRDVAAEMGLSCQATLMAEIAAIPGPFDGDPMSFLWVIFRPLAEWPGYGVDSDGGIWSCRKRGGKGSDYRFYDSWKRMRTRVNIHGYRMITLNRNGESFGRSVSKLVFSAFMGSRPEGMETCHGNGIRHDDRIVNLRWDTRVANQADKIKHGTLPVGERSGMAKLIAEDIPKIRAKRKDGHSLASLARQYGVAPCTIRNAADRVTWSHIR